MNDQSNLCEDPATWPMRRLDLGGVRELVGWAAAEGWNPGPHDAEVFYAADPGGFHGFFVDGRMVAGGALVSYGGRYGFMGLFIVRPDCRGRGIGRELWFRRRDWLRSRLEAGAAIGMDGVVAMQPFYARGGFVSAFKDERYRKAGARQRLDPRVRVLEAGDHGLVEACDSRCFGVPRPDFLKPWMALPGNRMFRHVTDGRLEGFVVMRKAGKGYKVGPLFADDGAVAERLYRACLDAVPGEDVFLDIPLANPEAVALVQRLGATPVFECARMYLGTPPEVPAGQVFGITSFELG